MDGSELALIANALVFMAALAVAFDVFESDSGDDADNGDGFPLFNAGDYSDQITGTDSDDAISAPDGTSFAFFLQAGNDFLNGSSGSDYVDAGEGNDALNLFEGDDIAFGGGGDDTVFAGRGDDIVDGGAGDDQIDGSLDNDTLNGGDGADTITGGAGDDIISGGAGDDILSGDRLDDTGSVARGIDEIDGGTGNDTLFLAGADTGTGGDGNDLFVVYNSEEPDDVVEITDFVKGQDSIELRYDEADEPPVFEISIDEETSNAMITLDGINVLKVNDAADLTTEDVTLAAA